MKLTANFDTTAATTQVSALKDTLATTLTAAKALWPDTLDAVNSLLADTAQLKTLQTATDSTPTLNHASVVLETGTLDLWGKSLDKLAAWDPATGGSPAFSLSALRLTTSTGNTLKLDSSLTVAKGIPQFLVKSASFALTDANAQPLTLTLSGGTGKAEVSLFSQAVMTYQDLTVTVAGQLVPDASGTETLGKLQISGLDAGSGMKTGSFGVDFDKIPAEGSLWDALQVTNAFGATWQSALGVPAYFAGDDVVTWLTASVSGSGAPYLNLGAGNDKLQLGTFDDTAFGSIGNDTVNGGAGNDTLVGDDLSYNAFSKRLYSMGSGNDLLEGGAGNDLLIGGLGVDTLDGGEGTDTASYYYAKAGVQVDLATGKAEGSEGKDVLKAIEAVNGSIYVDKLTGSAGDNTLNGDAGADGIWGGAGNDTLNGGEGNDSLSGGIGDDTLGGDNGNDLLNGEAGNDVITGGAGNDSLNGGEGNDSLKANEGRDSLVGGAGNDSLWGGAGNDVLTGGDGDDQLYGEDGSDTLTGGAGVDLFILSYPSHTGTDTFVDFVSGEDKIAFIRSNFSGLPTTLTAADLLVGAGKKATESGQKLIYDTTAGALYFDADGSAATAAVKLAIVGKATHPSLSLSDFFLG